MSACPNGTFFSLDTSSCQVCSSTCASCAGSATTCTGCPSGQILFNGACYSQCPFGTIASGSTCTTCDGSCGACSSSTSYCTSCSTGSLLIPSDHTCSVNGCPVGYIASAGSCVPCSQPCATCQTSTTTCTSCVNGTYLYDSVCYSVCPNGFVSSGSSCVLCQSPCSTCTNTAGTCTSCLSGFYLSGSACFSICPDGTFISGSSCAPCTSPCATCSVQSSSCTSCQVGTYLYQDTCVAQCPSGSVLSGSQCVPCTLPCATCSGSASSCSSCVSGYSMSGGVCVSNAALCAASSNGICLSCVAGYYLSQNQCVDTCPSSTYPTSNGECSSCSPPCSNCVGASTNCLTCINSYLYYNSTCQSACPLGTYPSNSVACSPCTFPCTSCSGSSLTCTTCDPSAPLLFQGSCYTACPTNAFQSGASACSLCSSSCLTCSGSSSSCTNCAAGQQLYHSDCYSKCPSGTYTNGTSCGNCVDNCQTCSNSAICDTCVAGYGVDQDGLCQAQQAVAGNGLQDDSSSIFYLLGFTAAIALVTIAVYFYSYSSRWHSSLLKSQYIWTGASRLPFLFAAVFDTISDAFFILVINETPGADIYFYAALAFTAAPYLINLIVALVVGFRNAVETDDNVEQTAWFAAALLTFFSGDVTQSISVALSVWIVHNQLIDESTNGRLFIYEKSFGSTTALYWANGLFAVQFLLRDLPHMVIQASFLTTYGSSNVIVILALIATIVTTSVGLFSFFFFTFIPLFQVKTGRRTSSFSASQHELAELDRQIADKGLSTEQLTRLSQSSRSRPSSVYSQNGTMIVVPPPPPPIARPTSVAVDGNARAPDPPPPIGPNAFRPVSAVMPRPPAGVASYP